jgi:phytol kinase
VTVLLPLLTALGAIAALLGVMAGVRHLAQRRGWAPEVQRKFVHVATGLFAMTLPWLFAEDWPVWVLLGLTLAVMAILRLPALRRGGLGATLHGVERRSYGDFLLALAVGVLFLLHNGEAVLYLLPLAIVTLADAAAALAGSLYGRRFFTVEDGRKSVEGSAVFFTVCLLLVMVALLLLTEVDRVNVVVLGLMVAAFATMVEADSWRGFDNLFLPLGTFFFLAANLDAAPWALFAQAVLFGAALLTFGVLAPSLGLSGHAARVHVIAVFLILSATQPQNAVLPVLLLAAHIWARLCNPSTERFPDLDIIAVLALISFGAMAAGDATGKNALSFFTLACGGVAAGLSSVAAGGRHPAVALALRGVAVAVLLAAWLWTAGQNPPEVHWHGTLWPFALALLAGMALLPALRPAAFAGERSLKLALAAIPPVALLYVLLLMTGPLMP